MTEIAAMLGDTQTISSGISGVRVENKLTTESVTEVC
jgi:hypothetical protein